MVLIAMLFWVKKLGILSYNNGVHSILYWVLFYCSGAVACTSLLLLLPVRVCQLLSLYGNPVAARASLLRYNRYGCCGTIDTVVSDSKSDSNSNRKILAE